MLRDGGTGKDGTKVQVPTGYYASDDAEFYGNNNATQAQVWEVKSRMDGTLSSDAVLKDTRAKTDEAIADIIPYFNRLVFSVVVVVVIVVLHKVKTFARSESQ